MECEGWDSYGLSCHELKDALFFENYWCSCWCCSQNTGKEVLIKLRRLLSKWITLAYCILWLTTPDHTIIIGDGGKVSSLFICMHHRINVLGIIYYCSKLYDRIQGIERKIGAWIFKWEILFCEISQQNSNSSGNILKWLLWCHRIFVDIFNFKFALRTYIHKIEFVDVFLGAERESDIDWIWFAFNLFAILRIEQQLAFVNCIIAKFNRHPVTQTLNEI